MGAAVAGEPIPVLRHPMNEARQHLADLGMFYFGAELLRRLYGGEWTTRRRGRWPFGRAEVGIEFAKAHLFVRDGDLCKLTLVDAYLDLKARILGAKREHVALDRLRPVG